MIRNPTVLRLMGISPKTAIHIGADKGQDRENYINLGIRLIVWGEAQGVLAERLKTNFPQDIVLNYYFSDNLDGSKDLKYSDEEVKPTQKVDNASKISLDEALQFKTFIKPIFLLIDTDGAEVKILEGGKSIISKVDYLVVEQHFHWNQGKWHEQITDLCLSLGFKRTLSRPSFDLSYEDVLYTRRSKLYVFTLSIMDYGFYIVKQIYHFIGKKHLSTSQFYCAKCKI